jgi:hypothetical protein
MSYENKRIISACTWHWSDRCLAIEAGDFRVKSLFPGIPARRELSPAAN